MKRRTAATKPLQEVAEATSHAPAALVTAADFIRGTPPELVALDRVKPNGWNPNRMTPALFESLKAGMAKDGWSLAHPLLVWGNDYDGRARDLIIDGEHRWRAARELGWTTGPVVYLHGISKPQAKALTIKLDQKRGRFDDAALSALLREIGDDLGAEDLGLELGFEDEELMRLLGSDDAPDEAPAPEEPERAPDSESAAGGVETGPRSVTEEMSHVRMVQLFLSDATVIDFMARCRALGERYGTGNVTDTVFEAIRREAERTE